MATSLIRLAAFHQSFRVKLPKFVPVGAVPLAVAVMVFVLKSHRDTVLVKTPQRFRKAIVAFILPFARQELADSLASAKKLIAISPLRVFRISQ